MAEKLNLPTLTASDIPETTEEPTTGAGSTAPVSEVIEQEPIEPVAEPTVEPTVVKEPVETPVVEPTVEETTVVTPEVSDINKQMQEFSQGRKLNEFGEEIEEPSQERVDEFNQKFTTTEAPKQPTTKVETAQDIKAKETSNEAQENELNETKKNQVVTEMQQMIQNGSTLEEIQAFGIKNAQFRDDINTVLRGSFKNVSNTAYFGKYSTLNNEDMYAAYQKGEVVPGSEQYNLLPDAQRARFDAFLSEKNAINVVKKTDYSTSDKVMDMTKLESAIPQMFSSNVRTRYEEKLNNPRIKELSAELTENKVQIDDIDDRIEDLQDEVERQAGPGALISQLNSRYKQEYKLLMKDKRLLLRERQISLGEYQSLKSDAETELKISMYEDGIAREDYQTQLNLYETRRKEALSRGQKIEDREFTLKTQIQAEERQRNFTVEMKKLDQQLKEQNKTGTYQTDRNGNLLYVVKGQATQVRNADGTVVGVTQKKDKYSESIQKNSDGTYSIFRTYTDGRKPEMFTYGIDGKSSYNTQMGVYDAISGLDKTGGKWFNGETGKLQCGEAVNRYLKTVGITDMRVGDSYESKKKIINNNGPQVGGLAVWNPNAEGKFGEFGHIGMVTGYNPEKGEVEITDWNKDGDGLKNTYNIPVSQVLNSDGGFVHLEGGGTPQVEPLSDKQFTQLNQFTSRFASNPVVKSFESALSSGGDLVASLKSESGPGDVAAVFGFMKTLDPTSVVRESEFALAENTAGISSKPGILLSKVESGERLTDEQRKEFGRVAFEFVKNKGKLYDTKYDEFERIMTNQGIPKEYFPTRFTDLINEIEEGPKKQQSSTINSLSEEFNSYNNSATGVSNTQADYSSTLGF